MTPSSSHTGSPPADLESVRLGAPWYVHPTEDPSAWRRLLGGDNSLDFAVINPADGPGPSDDPYYTQVLADGSSTSLLGYVDVAYGDRSVPEMLADVRAWLDRYPVRGVMLDQVPSQAEQGHWGLDVIEEIRGAGATTVMANPGTPPDPELILRADLTCVAEQDWETFRGWRPPLWLSELPADKLWILLYGVPVASQEFAMKLIGRRGAGFGWATSGRLPNPWAVLPQRW